MVSWCRPRHVHVLIAFLSGAFRTRCDNPVGEFFHEEEEGAVRWVEHEAEEVEERVGIEEQNCKSKHRPKNTKCKGCPPRYKGKLCASTTRYNDQTLAACGCGPSDPVPRDWWTLTRKTAALNCKNLDVEYPRLSWCPHGCGACFRLCSTGGTTQGLLAESEHCEVFKITNRCGDGYKEYPMWCSQEITYQECVDDPEKCMKENSTNWFGYPAHFDLQDFHLQVSDALEWDNAEVTFEAVPCEENWVGPKWNCTCEATGDKEEEPLSEEAEFEEIAGELSGQMPANHAEESHSLLDVAAGELATAAEEEGEPTVSPAEEMLGSVEKTMLSFSEGDSFCCHAAEEEDDFCATCTPTGVAEPDSWCGLSKKHCTESCGSHSHWCTATKGQFDGVARKFSRPVEQTSIFDVPFLSLGSNFAWYCMLVVLGLTAIGFVSMARSRVHSSCHRECTLAASEESDLQQLVLPMHSAAEVLASGPMDEMTLMQTSGTARGIAAGS